MDYYEEWTGGTGFYINGYTNNVYSNSTLLELAELMELEKLEIEVINIDEKEATYKNVKNYEGDEYTYQCIGVKNIHKFNSLNNYIRCIYAYFSLYDKNIPCCISPYIHEDDTVTINFMFEYGHIRYEENKNRKNKLIDATRKVAKKIYSANMFIYGFSGEEVEEISKNRFQDTSLQLAISDSYFSTLLINKSRIDNLEKINLFDMKLIYSINNNDFIGVYICVGKEFHDYDTEEQKVVQEYESWLAVLREKRIKY